MQGTQVRSLFWEELVRHYSCATTEAHAPGAHAPQQEKPHREKPVHLEPTLRNKRSLTARSLCAWSPCSATREASQREARAPGAHAPQQEKPHSKKPMRLEPMLHNKRSLTERSPGTTTEGSSPPPLELRDSPLAATKTHAVKNTHKRFQKTNEDNPCLPYKTIVRISWDHVSGMPRAGLGTQSVPMAWGIQPIKVLLALLTVLVTS